MFYFYDTSCLLHTLKMVNSHVSYLLTFFLKFTVLKQGQHIVSGVGRVLRPWAQRLWVGQAQGA